MKAIVYVDDYNLFYGCLKHSQDKWLDLWQLFFDQILKAQCPHTKPESLKFFTADIKAKVANYGQRGTQAQLAYHRALQALYPDTIQIIKGYYSLEKANLPIYQHPPDKKNRVHVWRIEEKQTDVNIAIEAYRDAVKRRAEQLVFVSNDTDLAPVLSALREDFGEALVIGVVIPVRKEREYRPVNRQLSRYADWTRRYITDVELSQSQLPDRVPTRKKPILKPEYW